MAKCDAWQNEKTTDRCAMPGTYAIIGRPVPYDPRRNIDGYVCSIHAKRFKSEGIDAEFIRVDELDTWRTKQAA